MSFDRTIHPHEGVGLLRFGMSRAEVAAIHGPPATQVEQFGGTVVDYYPEDLVSLSFDSRRELNFIEWHARNPSILDGVVIDDGATLEVVERLRAVACEPVTTDTGIDFPRVGVAIYAPDRHVEGVAAYREGYYDDEWCHG